MLELIGVVLILAKMFGWLSLSWGFCLAPILVGLSWRLIKLTISGDL